MKTHQEINEEFDAQFPRFKNRAFTEETADILKFFFHLKRQELLDEVIGDVKKLRDEESEDGFEVTALTKLLLSLEAKKKLI